MIIIVMHIKIVKIILHLRLMITGMNQLFVYVVYHIIQAKKMSHDFLTVRSYEFKIEEGEKIEMFSWNIPRLYSKRENLYCFVLFLTIFWDCLTL
jgi:hypothetical protein